MNRITISTQLLRLDPYRDNRSGPPQVYVVTGETRQSWLVEREPASGGFVTKVDKETMLERGKGERKARFMTVPEYEHSQRVAQAQARLHEATSSYTWLNSLSDEKLDQLAALLEVKGYEPVVQPAAPVASGPHGDVVFYAEDDGEVCCFEIGWGHAMGGRSSFKSDAAWSAWGFGMYQGGDLHDGFGSVDEVLHAYAFREGVYLSMEDFKAGRKVTIEAVVDAARTWANLPPVADSPQEWLVGPKA